MLALLVHLPAPYPPHAHAYGPHGPLTDKAFQGCALAGSRVAERAPAPRLEEAEWGESAREEPSSGYACGHRRPAVLRPAVKASSENLPLYACMLGTVAGLAPSSAQAAGVLSRCIRVEGVHACMHRVWLCAAPENPRPRLTVRTCGGN
jgi:hypothetical protein